MIRVLHLAPCFGIGGTEAMLLAMCAHRDARRFEYAVACQSPSESPLLPEIEATGVRVLRQDDAIAEAVEKADVINVHALSADSRVFNYLHEAGKLFVATLHWVCTMPPIRGIVLCTSRRAREYQEAYNRCIVIPNGVDCERFSAASRPEREKVVITRVCRPPKCAPYFWEVVGRVLARCPEAHFRIVGNEGPCRHPDPRVEFLGVRRDIPEILADSDIFFYTPYPEIGSMDVAVLEAAAAGLPCVTSDVSVVREALAHGETALLCPYGDVESTEEALVTLVKDRERRARMGKAAVRRTREHFHIAGVTRRYEAVYQAVWEAAGGRRPADLRFALRRGE